MDFAATGQRPPKRGPPLRVLYVDDNHDMADSAVELCNIVGFEARACYDGASALAEAEAFRPGVCMIDLHMPGMDGDELALRLRSGGGLPVLVAVTAMSDEQSRARIAAAGFDLHLVKPVDPHKLMGVLDALWHAWHGGRWEREELAEAINRAAGL